jgi:hypothetical protein
LNVINTMASNQRMDGESKYDYKVVSAPTSLLWLRVDRDATEQPCGGRMGT